MNTINNTSGKGSFSNFLIIWVGQLLSNIGGGLTAFALGIYVFQLTESATSYSFILLSAFLPSLLLKPIGGALSDRMDRRLLMIIGDLGAAAGVIFIICMMSLGIMDLWVIYLGVIFSSVAESLANPAYKASVTDLVDEEMYAKASGLLQLSESARFIISPLVAGLLLKFIDIKQILIIDALTFIVSIGAVFWIKQNVLKEKKKQAPKQHFIADFLSGFRFLYANKGLMYLLSITSLITFFIGFLMALLGPMILVFANAETLGFSQTTSTTGMLVSSLFIGMFSKSTNKIKTLCVALFIAGVFFALLGVSTNIFVITGFGFLFFLSLPFVNTSLDVLVRKQVPNHMQGRIWSLVSLISQFGMVVAFGIAGFLADKVFNPLFEPQGALASTVGTIIGTGPGRGIGFMFIISGVFVSLIALVMSRLKILRELE